MMSYKIQVGGAGVHYLRVGFGPALVLVHGLVGSSQNWEPNLDSLAAVRTVYALDLINMGQSGRVAGINPGLEASADRLAACMDALGIACADVAAHSHGGAVAMMLAIRHPKKVRKLILFAPANPYCDLGRGLIEFYNSHLGTWFARRIPKLPRFVHNLAHRRMYVDQRRVTLAALDGYTRNLNSASIEHILGILSNWWSDMSLLQSRLAELAGKPILLIWGERDSAVGLESGKELAAMLGAPLVVLPDVGHLPFAEKPEDCNRLVREWLVN